MTKEFQINDLVWAKMKGYSPWPGKIVAPPPDSKLKKNCQYIYFFGSENYGWINDDSIELHSDETLEKYKNRKGALLQKAVEYIIEHSKKEKFSEAEKTDHEQQYEPGNASSSEVSKQDNTNAPSASGGDFFNIKGCAERFDKFFDLNSEDEAEGYDHPPHSDAVIPHPNLMNYTVPPVNEPYIERPESPPFDFSKNKCLKERNIVPTKKKIGFLGFTKKAKCMVKNLSQSGHSVIIWNKAQKECKMFADKLKVKNASTPADVIKATDIIFSCVSDASIVENLVLGSLLKEIEHSKEKKGYVEMTTISPEMSEMIATEIKMKGGLYLEAPSCGSSVDAAEGTLYITTAGDKTLYDDCKSCFDAISKEHVYMSPEIGTAIKMNAVQSMFYATVNVGLAESVSLVETKGLGDFFKDILQISDLNSSNLVHKAEAMVNKNFQTETSINEMQEQFTLGLALGHEVSLSTPVFSMANEAYKKAKMMKYGEHDISAVIEATKQ